MGKIETKLSFPLLTVDSSVGEIFRPPLKNTLAISPASAIRLRASAVCLAMHELV